METPRYLIFVVVIIAILIAMIPQNIFFFISLFDLIFKSKSGDVDPSVPKEQKCLNYINRHAIKGNATSVLNAIDKFGWEESFLMNVGDIKGQILTDELKKSSPKFVLEVGAYLGYSAVRIASQLPADSHLISVELSPLHISYARQTVEHAGLTDRVTFLEGTVPTTSLKSFLAQRNVENFDFIFLDHHKGFYLPDLKYLLSEKLIQPNATIVADNVLLPGAPDYWYYVIFDSKFSTKSHLSRIEYLPLPDIVTVSKFLGY